jgi:hypothetical protein
MGEEAMSDIRCSVCGEPFESYGIDHGDFLPWQAKLFRQGAGCPICEGEPRNGEPWQPQTISDVENGDGDEIERIHVAERVADGTAPKWERPKDPIHWTCNGCGVNVITNVDDNQLEYDVPWSSKARHWYHSHPFYNGTPEKEPAHTFDSGEKVCEFCLTHCSECDAPLSEHLDLEMYSEGYAMPSPADEQEHVCMDCHSEVETEEANRVWESCYSDKKRIQYIRKHRSQFEFNSFAEMLGCCRGKFFNGYASELLG